jgi:ATP-dependent Lon protease
MNKLDEKMNDIFVGKVVPKGLVFTLKGNEVVPTYVLEYLLGQYCATNDETSRNEGINRVKEILRDHYVHRQEGGLVRSLIKEKGRHKVIDKVNVSLNEKDDCYEGKFSNLGISKVVFDSHTVKKNKKILVSDIWSIVDLEYEYTENKHVSPWILKNFRPIQLASFDSDEYIVSRDKFTTEEWMDLLIQSIGLNPEGMNRRSKLLYLTRLIPYCERNYNIMELGPKGTGKSHVYSDFSPHSNLISGGVVTVPKLFVNNSNGKLGLIGYFDCIAFDEFAGKTKKIKNELVDIMKNYMANKTFSRGAETLEAEASFAFIGNTQHNVPYMLKHSHLFDDLPQTYQDTAFLDRIPILRTELFTKGQGLIVDYLAEALRYFRNYDFMSKMDGAFALHDSLTKRDKEGIKKTVSGFLKILYPHEKYTHEELKELVLFAMEGRKRVKDQLIRMDETFRKEWISFSFIDKVAASSGSESVAADSNEPTDSNSTDEHGEGFVKTLEEKRYPAFYHRFSGGEEEASQPEEFAEMMEVVQEPVVQDPSASSKSASTTNGNPASTSTSQSDVSNPNLEPKASSQSDAPKLNYIRKGTMGNYLLPNLNANKLQQKAIHVEENQTGFSFAKYFGPYFIGAKKIVIEDPFIHAFHQMKNLVELIETIISFKTEEEEIDVLLKTTVDNFDPNKQKGLLEDIQKSLQNTGINFNFDFTCNHDRHIWIDDKWHIFLGRGLDIFQKCNSNSQIDINCYLQTQRPCRAFTAQITRLEKGEE